MGEKIMEKRRIKLGSAEGYQHGNDVHSSLLKTDGIISVEIDRQKNQIQVEYELKKINFEAIEQLIKKLGIELSNNWHEKFKRGMSKFTEQNELDNLNAPVSSCCDDPKAGTKACRR
ncbi:MAG: heavy-metal-associated domain-containing protein [Candidatus Aminicenantaceae bacterium]